MRGLGLGCLALWLAMPALAAPGNDDCAGATVVTTLPFQHAADTSSATLEGGEPAFTCHAGSVGPTARTVWYAFTAPQAMTIEVDTHDTPGPGTSTALAAYGGACGALTQIACNGFDFDDYAPGDTSRMLVTLGAGETAFMQVWQNTGAPDGVVVTMRESAVFHTNTTSPADVLGWPVVAAQPGGGFIAAWRESAGVLARRYDADGIALGAPFLVSTSLPQDSRLGIDADGAGNVVVSWRGAGGVFAHRIDAAGALVGSEITVAGSSYRWTNVGVDADGDFVVVWDGGDVMARRFDASGVPAGAAFSVSAAGDPRYPKVGMAPDGRFVVTWTDGDVGDGDGAGVFARAYDAAGSPTGALFLVNETTTGGQGYFGGPGISVADDGTFVIAWDDGECPGYDCVQARRFDATGSPAGGEFLVTESHATGYNYAAAVDHDPSGAFVVSWVSTDEGPMARRFDAAGAPAGAQLRVGLESYQFYGDVAAGSDGFMVVWDWEVTGSDTIVYGRRMPVHAPPVCTGTPRAGCRSAPKGVLSIKEKDPDKGDRFTWKWVKGAATSPADFGNPLADDSYVVCLYEDGFRTTRAQVNGGGTCGVKPCWKDLGGNGGRYVEKKALIEGTQKLVLKAGGAGAAKLVFKGKGTRLREPFGFGQGSLLPLGTPVTVQLVASTGVCWESIYDAGITSNTAAKFLGKPG